MVNSTFDENESVRKSPAPGYTGPVHSVAVEGFEGDADTPVSVDRFPESDSSQVVAASEPKSPYTTLIDVGFAIVSAFLIVLALNLTVATSNNAKVYKVLLDQPDLVIATSLLAIGTLIAFLASRFRSDIELDDVANRLRNTSASRRLSIGRLISGTIVAGIGCFVVLVSLRSFEPPWWSFIAAGLGLSGWAIARQNGESILRSISLGIAWTLPLIVVCTALHAPTTRLLERISCWTVGTVLDLGAIAHRTVFEDSHFIRIDLVEGSINKLLVLDNVTGLMIPFGLVLATSLIFRQSLIMTTMSTVVAIAWWILARTWTIYSMASNPAWHDNLSPLAEQQALSFALFLFILVAILATQLFLKYFFDSIPLADTNMEHPALGQLYNFVVNFPQTGERHPDVFSVNQIQSTVDRSRVVDPGVAMRDGEETTSSSDTFTDDAGYELLRDGVAATKSKGFASAQTAASTTYEDEDWEPVVTSGKSYQRNKSEVSNTRLSQRNASENNPKKQSKPQSNQSSINGDDQERPQR